MFRDVASTNIVVGVRGLTLRKLAVTFLVFFSVTVVDQMVLGPAS